MECNQFRGGRTQPMPRQTKLDQSACHEGGISKGLRDPQPSIRQVAGNAEIATKGLDSS